MSAAPNETASAAKVVVCPRPWSSPRLAELPKLSALTLASPIGGGGGTGGGGSTVFGILLALLSLSGCLTERGNGPSEGMAPVLAQTISCHADVARGTVDCLGPSAVDREIIGGQGSLVALRSSNVNYAGGVFSFDVTVQNLTSGYLGWDQFTAESIAVFFEAAPATLTGTGTITFANASGPATFTSSGQYYFAYDSLPAGATSLPLNWQFNVPGTVTTFDFHVQVAAQVPDYGGVTRWTQVPEFMDLTVDPLTDIAVNSANDAMAVGDNGRVLRKVGNSWRQLPVQIAEDWVAVEAIGGGKYLGATADTVYLFDGRVWKSVYAPGFPILSLSGTATDRIIVGGFEQLRWLGTGGWQSVGVGGRTYKWVAALGGDQAVALATVSGQVRINFNSGTVSSTSDGFDHTAFYAGPVGNFGFGAMNGGVPPAYIKDDASGFLYGPKNDTIVDALDFGATAAERWAVMRSVGSGVSVLRHLNAGTWSTVATLPSPVIRMTQDSAGGLYLLFADGIRQWNGSAVVDRLVMNDSITAIWGNDALAYVGMNSGAVWRYSGGSWTNTGNPTGAPVLSVQGFTATSASAFDTLDNYLVFDGSSWTNPSNWGGIRAFWATALNDGVIVQHFPGILTNICRGDPMTCPGDIDPAGVSTALNAVWGTSSNDFWVAGDGGVVLHYAGGVYTAHNTGFANDLLAIHGTSNSDLWVAGTDGFFAHWNGGAWHLYGGFTTESIGAVWAPRPEWVYLSFGVGQLMAVDLNGELNPVSVPFSPGNVTAMSGVSTNSVWAAVGRSLYRGTR